MAKTPKTYDFDGNKWSKVLNIAAIVVIAFMILINI